MAQYIILKNSFYNFVFPIGQKLCEIIKVNSTIFKMVHKSNPSIKHLLENKNVPHSLNNSASYKHLLIAYISTPNNYKLFWIKDHTFLMFWIILELKYIKALFKMACPIPLRHDI